MEWFNGNLCLGHNNHHSFGLLLSTVWSRVLPYRWLSGSSKIGKWGKSPCECPAPWGAWVGHRQWVGHLTGASSWNWWYAMVWMCPPKRSFVGNLVFNAAVLGVGTSGRWLSCEVSTLMVTLISSRINGLGYYWREWVMTGSVISQFGFISQALSPYAAFCYGMMQKEDLCQTQPLSPRRLSSRIIRIFFINYSNLKYCYSYRKWIKTWCIWWPSWIQDTNGFKWGRFWCPSLRTTIHQIYRFSVDDNAKSDVPLGGTGIPWNFGIQYITSQEVAQEVSGI